MNYRTVIEKAEYLIKISQELKENPSPEKSSGLLTIVLNGFSEEIPLKIGDISLDKELKYKRLSKEKAHRVFSHWLRNNYSKNPVEVVSSYQTRNKDEGKFGGAVLFERETGNEFPEIISFSGGSEFTDESISYILGENFGLAKEGLLYKVKNISKNPLIDEMLFEFNKKYSKVA